MKVDDSRCNHCGSCVRSCGMDVRHVGDHECINCGKCMEVCAQKAISIKAGSYTLKAPEGGCADDTEQTVASRKNFARILWGVALGVLCAALLWFNFLDPTVRKRSAQKPAPTPPAAAATAAPAESSEAAPVPAPAEEVSFESSAPIGYEVGQQLQDFTVSTFDGGEFHLADHRGQIVIINLWGTYCTPCVQELPEFEKLCEEHEGEVAILAAIGAVIQPFICHVGMVKVDNWTVAHRGKHVVARWCCAHRLQQWLIVGMIACGTHQRRHRSTSTGAVGDNPLGIARNLVVKIANIANGGLKVKNSIGSTTSENLVAFLQSRLLIVLRNNHARVAATSARNHNHHAFLEGSPASVAYLRNTSPRCHVPAHVGAQQYWRLTSRRLGHIHIKILIHRVLHVGNIVEPLVCHVVYRASIKHRHGAWLALGGVELQFLLSSLAPCASKTHYCQSD